MSFFVAKVSFPIKLGRHAPPEEVTLYVDDEKAFGQSDPIGISMHLIMLSVIKALVEAVKIPANCQSVIFHELYWKSREGSTKLPMFLNDAMYVLPPKPRLPGRECNWDNELMFGRLL